MIIGQVCGATLKIYDSATYYGVVTKLFHWLTALLVIGLFILGFWMVDLTYYSQWYQTAPFYHESFGILLSIIFLLRLVWRVKQNKPLPLISYKKWEIQLASIMKALLLGLISIVIISGFLIVTADNRTVDFFGLNIPAFLGSFEKQEDIAGAIHYWSTYVLIGLVLLHVIAALKHHFIDKDVTLKRML